MGYYQEYGKRQFTIAAVKRYVKANCPHVKIRYNADYGEFRVAYRGLVADREEAMASYTNDPEDAQGTANRFEAEYHRVEEFDKLPETLRYENLVRRAAR